VTDETLRLAYERELQLMEAGDFATAFAEKQHALSGLALRVLEREGAITPDDYAAAVKEVDALLLSGLSELKASGGLGDPADLVARALEIRKGAAYVDAVAAAMASRLIDRLPEVAPEDAHSKPGSRIEGAVMSLALTVELRGLLRELGEPDGPDISEVLFTAASLGAASEVLRGGEFGRGRLPREIKTEAFESEQRKENRR
jgi:hypothetical protein